MRSWARHVTPSMVVACIALIVALGGPSIAATVGNAIDGETVERASLPGNRVVRASLPANRIRPNSLTGRQVNERRLDSVPRADAADVAENARALGGSPASAFRTLATRTIPSGTTVTGAFGLSANFITTTGADLRQVVSLPGLASADLTDATVNFATAAAVMDADPACVGTAQVPSAPAGKVCLYLSSFVGGATQVSGEAIPLLAGSRPGFVVHASQAGAATGVFGTWAYTAP